MLSPTKGNAIGHIIGEQVSPLKSLIPQMNLGKVGMGIVQKVSEIGSNDFKYVTKNFLSKHGIKDIHRFKNEFLIGMTDIAEFDIARHTKTGELLIVKQKTQQIVEYTGVYIKNQ